MSRQDKIEEAKMIKEFDERAAMMLKVEYNRLLLEIKKLGEDAVESAGESLKKWFLAGYISQGRATFVKEEVGSVYGGGGPYDAAEILISNWADFYQEKFLRLIAEELNIENNCEEWDMLYILYVNKQGTEEQTP